MKLLPSLTPDLTDWALKQPVFFIASAPTHGAHVNVSPKGLPSSNLAVLGPNSVAYVDRTGSGCETIAHLYENGRVTLMFMSLGSDPRVLSLFCRGKVVEFDDPAFPSWLERLGHKRPAAVRSIILLDIFHVGTSYGYAVPRVRRELYDVTARPFAEGPDAQDDGSGVGEAVFEGEGSVFEDRPTLMRSAVTKEEGG